MQYTLKQLRYFAAAAEEGSVTAAAKTIRVSQPSISEAIAHLEEAFDLQLFVRHHARGLAHGHGVCRPLQGILIAGSPMTLRPRR